MVDVGFLVNDEQFLALLGCLPGTFTLICGGLHPSNSLFSIFDDLVLAALDGALLLD